MVRPYGIKGKKRKNREEKYDREEGEEKEMEANEETPSPKRAVTEKTSVEEEEEEEEVQLEGIPIAPAQKKANKPGVIFILEKASLEVAKVGKSYQLLNSDDHAHFLRKNNKNPAEYRPDIAHQYGILELDLTNEFKCSSYSVMGIEFFHHIDYMPIPVQALLTILDSPINKAGRVQALYVRTDKGVLFEVKPHVRIPRTYKRFSGIMLQLLQKLSITASGKREKLLWVIKNPVTQYLPLNSRKIGFSYSSEKLVKIKKYVKTVGDDVSLVFVVGAWQMGK